MARVPDEVWAYTILGALLLSMGGSFVFYALHAPVPGSSAYTWFSSSPLFFVPAGGLLGALGVYLVWKAELIYRKTRFSRS